MRLNELKNLKESEDLVLLSMRRDAGDEWKYWTGINWLGTKARALPVKISDVKQIEQQWRLRARQQPAPKMNEEALETKTAEDLWSENSDGATYFVSTTPYLVRQIKDTSPVQYEAFSIEGDVRKPFGKFTADTLKKVLEPSRSGQKPDAEGFTTYRDPNKVEAFQYKGDPIKVMMDKIGGRLNDGDYLVRSNDGNDFTYTIEKASSFEASLTKA
jgi:hypothetical protein